MGRGNPENNKNTDRSYLLLVHNSFFLILGLIIQETKATIQVFSICTDR